MERQVLLPAEGGELPLCAKPGLDRGAAAGPSAARRSTRAAGFLAAGAAWAAVVFVADGRYEAAHRTEPAWSDDMTATASTEAAQSYTRLQPTGDSNPDAKFALVVKPADDDGSGAGPVPGVAVSNKYIARDGPLGSSAWYASWLAGGVLVEPFKPATFSLVLSGSYADDDPTFATALAAAEACAWTATRYASDQGAYELDLRGTGAEVASLTSALSPGDANGHTLQLTFDTLGLHRVSASLDGGATVLAGDVWVRYARAARAAPGGRCRPPRAHGSFRHARDR
jgi:hypothetical protein